MDTIKIDHGNVRMIAHRGLSGIETENTCAAFVAACNRNYFGIETDVHVTSDGKYAIIHDDNTIRVSGKDYIVEKTGFTELSQLRLYERGSAETRSDLLIPSLRDYCRICNKYEKISVLELKNHIDPAHISGIIEEIRALDQLQNTIFISFDIENCRTVRRMLPDQKVQFLTDWSDVLPELLHSEKLDIDIYHPHLTPERVSLLHGAGIEINCWTCDSPERANELISMGVDYITSNILE